MALLYKKEDKLVTITLNRPEALNAYDPEQAYEFADALVKFRDDPDAWVGIITGAGDRAFCAGADLKKMVPVSQSQGSLQYGDNIMRGLRIWKPLIAAINGIAFGGGMETALACDIRIASENAVMGVPEVKWGLIPGWGGTQRLPRLINGAKAAELLLLGASVTAAEALEIGLINAVVPRDQLIPTAKEWALKICCNGPIAVRAAKQCMLEGLDVGIEDGLAIEERITKKLLATDDVSEGLKAFAEKREPKFTNR